MNSIQNIDLSYKNIINLEGDIIEAARLIKSIGIKGGMNFFGMIHIFFMVVQKNIQSRIQLKKFRAMFNKHAVDSVKDKESADTFAAMKKEIKIMRDAYIILETNLKRTRSLNFLLHRSVKNTLKEWDDFLEDFDIGTDPEIHSLIRKISEAA